MPERTSKTKEHEYTCGQCGNIQYALVGEKFPDACVDCGYVHGARDKYDVPAEIKLDLTKYG